MKLIKINIIKKLKLKLMILGVMLVSVTLISACSPKEDDPKPDGPNGPDPAGDISLETDKSRYQQGATVKFTASQSLDGYLARYKYLDEIVAEQTLSSSTWQWTTPQDDFRGYLVEILSAIDAEEPVATIAVDVSSSWTKFPRYGFLSKYSQMNQAEIDQVIKNLNRHHINGIQFYDWHYKHHQPLAGTANNPEPVYQDIIGRDIYLQTVEDYIAAAHDKNMQAMHYNLIFGALQNAEANGVQPEWYLYEDKNNSTINKHPLPQPPFISDIYLTNPGNEQWQQYLVNENEKVYQALNFDGFHMDQLGDRGRDLYTYDAAKVALPAAFESFIESMHLAHPQKYYVLNAVNQYGQEQIAQAPVDFLYTEVWDPNNTYADLANIIKNNLEYSNGTLNTVLAAYLNYDKSNSSGVFNTPGVLLADAVIFAFGGAHLELGEHMLSKEYFPHSNLVMRKDLQEALVNYYDFMVAYQNLLRDGGEFNQPSVTTYSGVQINHWPPKQGAVSVAGKKVGQRQVLHFINFTDASHLLWRDTNGEQNYPQTINSFAVDIAVEKNVQKVWFASPDVDGGAAMDLSFTQNGNKISVTIPSLKYWDMLVIEY